MQRKTMCNDLLTQYEKLTKDLENEQEANRRHFLDNLISAMLRMDGKNGGGSEKDFNSLDGEISHEIAMISLRCLRISVICRLLEIGDQSKRVQLKQDIADVIESVREIECKEWTTNAVIYDALDLMTAVCPQYEHEIRKNAPHRFLGKGHIQAEISKLLYYLFVEVAAYYDNINLEKLAYEVLERLCNLSVRRNSPATHRMIVTNVITLIGDLSPETICRIGDAQITAFEAAVDDDAGNFFWYYGNALEKDGFTEKTRSMFKRCYDIRLQIDGEESWYTAVAKREYTISDFVLSQGQKGTDVLYQFVDDIEHGAYDPWFEDREALEIIEGKTLCSLLVAQTNIDDPDSFDHYSAIYERICDRYDDSMEPLIKRKLAKNQRGRYYFAIGDYIQAERAFLEALEADAPERVSAILSDTQIKTNILFTYYLQNDTKKGFSLLDELLELMEDDEDDVILPLKDKYRVLCIYLGMLTQSMVSMDQEDLDWLKSMLEESCDAVFHDISCFDECGKEAAGFMINAVMALFQNDCISPEEAGMYLDAMSFIEKDTETFSFDMLQRILLYFGEEFIAVNINHPDAEAFLHKMLDSANRGIRPWATLAAVYQLAAVHYDMLNEPEESAEYLKKSLSAQTDVWHCHVRYLNDSRLIQILMTTQMQFLGCYAILRGYEDIETAYEQLLRFKALASLAGRERSRVIHSGSVDTTLLGKIQTLQNHIATLETSQIFRDVSEEYEATEKKLRELEAEFAARFPKNVSFTEITWDRVQQAMPDNSVVLEYFYATSQYKRRLCDQLPDETDITVVDIYITVKKNGKCSLRRLTAKNGDALQEKAQELVTIMQAISDDTADIAQLSRQESLRSDLYKALVKPVLSYLDRQKTIYIAPDYELLNLPFEILYDEDGERLVDHYNVIKIECARDFLFDSADSPTGCGDLIIGNPDYEVEECQPCGEKQDESGLMRSIRLKEDNIHPLPFAELEARRVSERSGSSCFCGSAAAKKLLLSAQGYENIHIATHGFFGLAEETDAIYSACLIFAGVKNWLRTGNVSEAYGNGIVTADEISRLDLRSVKLAVLSSCLSGMNEIYGNTGFQGLVGAMSAAGVKYVISHLWAANDFSTAILMDKFYYYYKEENQAPPAALALAQEYLKNITVGELKRQGWFDYARDIPLDEKIRAMLDSIEGGDERAKPFKNEAYWGGFACYRCN